MMLLAASATPRPTDSAVPDVQEVVDQMNSNASAEDKTSFLLEYLMAQREPLLNFGKTLLIALIVFLIGKRIIALLLKLLNRWMERSHVEVSVHKFIMSLGRVLLYILLIFCVAGILGVGTSSIIAIIGSAGLAVGLALQGSLSNFAGGVLILLLKPFEVGDYIIEDTNHNEGTVKEIQIFYTKLSTVDNKTIVIPNGMLTNNSLTNATAKAERKLDLKVDIAYEADLRKAKAVIEEIIRQDDATIKNEEILVFVHELAESSVVIGARAWVKNEDYWNARWRILEEIKLKLDENEIEMAYPHLTVQMGKEN